MHIFSFIHAFICLYSYMTDVADESRNASSACLYNRVNISRGCGNGDVHIWTLHKVSKSPDKDRDDLPVGVASKSRLSRSDEMLSDENEAASDDDPKHLDGLVEPLLMLSEKQEKPTDTLTGHDGLIICLDFNQNGALLASGCANGVVNIWSMQVV